MEDVEPESHNNETCLQGHLNIPEKVSLQDRCPFIIGYATWAEDKTKTLWENLLWLESVLIGMSLEYRFYVLYDYLLKRKQPQLW